MILSHFKKDETQDVDLLRPSKDKLLQKLSGEIAKDFG